MTVVSVETLEELKKTWLRRITCIFYSLNYDVNIGLLIYMELARSSGLLSSLGIKTKRN